MADKKGVRKRSIVIAGHPTSLSMEDEFWEALKEIALEKGCSLREVIQQIDGMNPNVSRNLSSSLRLFVLAYYRQKSGF